MKGHPRVITGIPICNLTFMYRLTLSTSLLFSLSLKTVCCRADKELKALRQDLAERVETLSKDVGDAEQVFQVLTSCPCVPWVPALAINTAL